MKKPCAFLLVTGIFMGSTFAGEPSPGHSHSEATASPAGAPAKTGIKATRTVDVIMRDSMRFMPENIEVKEGETVRFFVKNEGKMTHEFLIGSNKEIGEHAQMMMKDGMASMNHDNGTMITLKSGQKGAVTWTFDKAGKFNFACTVPGHLEAGMIGTVTVK